MTGFDSTLFWPALAAANMLVVATAKPKGGAVTVNVGFWRPGEERNGTVSMQYLVEYQTADLARLAEGDAFNIGAEKFRVRATPMPQGDGFYTLAELTKQ